MAYIPDEAFSDIDEVGQKAFLLFAFYCKHGARTNNRVTVSLEKAGEFLSIAYENACRLNAVLKKKGWIKSTKTETVLLKGWTDENVSLELIKTSVEQTQTDENVSSGLTKTSVAYKEEPALLNQRGEAPSKDHPAIRMIVEITKRYPSKDLWERICREIEPDLEFFKSSFEVWRSVGGNPLNYEKWLFIPNRTKTKPEVFERKTLTQNSLPPATSWGDLETAEADFIKSLKSGAMNA